VVPRPRLIARLNVGLHRKLTLIAAPAGFGKTTLVSAWVAGCGRATAWLSLDAGDNDPARFLLHLVAALQTIALTLGEGVLGALHSPEPPPTEALLTALLNEITTLPDQIVLVLDDYHVIDAPAVDTALIFRKRRRCSARETASLKRVRGRKWSRSSSWAVQNRAAESKEPNPRMG